MRALLSVILLFASAPVFANGGGPLLLYWNLAAFIFGSIFIVIIEAYVYRTKGGISKTNSLKDSFIANLWSTVLIGFGFPLVLAAITGGLSEALPSQQGYFLAIGTWLVDWMQFPKATVAFVYFWLVVSFLLTVPLEQYVLSKRWSKRGEPASANATRLCWLGNSATYALLLVALTLVFLVSLP